VTLTKYIVSVYSSCFILISLTLMALNRNHNIAGWRGGPLSRRKCTMIVRGQYAVDGAGVRLRRVLSGNYHDNHGAVKGEYVKVQYLDIALEPDSVWHYRETSNDQTLFLYLIDRSFQNET